VWLCNDAMAKHVIGERESGGGGKFERIDLLGSPVLTAESRPSSGDNDRSRLGCVCGKQTHPQLDVGSSDNVDFDQFNSAFYTFWSKFGSTNSRCRSMVRHLGIDSVSSNYVFAFGSSGPRGSEMENGQGVISGAQVCPNEGSLHAKWPVGGG